jgi:enoyl-CoA hydratase
MTDAAQTSTGQPELLVRKDGAIATVSFNNPEKLNAFTRMTAQLLYAAFTDLAEDESVKVIVLRGEGRAFSTGGNMNWVGTQYDDEVPQEGRRRRSPQRRYLGQDERGFRVWESILHSNKVVIAEAKGYVLGVALEWLLASDIIICAEGTVLGSPPARMAGVTGMSTVFWMLRLGPALHAEMTLMGRYITAEEALERDVINRVVPIEQLEATVQGAADAVCQLPADGLAIGKYNRKAAYDILGVRTSLMQSAMGHAMQVQQRIDDGEWHLPRERAQYGMREAIRRRDQRFEEALARFKPSGD